MSENINFYLVINSPNDVHSRFQLSQKSSLNWAIVPTHLISRRLMRIRVIQRLKRLKGPNLLFYTIFILLNRQKFLEVIPVEESFDVLLPGFVLVKRVVCVQEGG